jgi:Rad3-related DNA helicase
MLSLCHPLDPQVRWPGSVIVFDEAHNLEGVAAEAWSVEMSTTTLALVMKELDEAFEKWKAKGAHCVVA